MTVEVTLFTDPACPFAFSAEPARMRLRWHYGDGLRWTVRMIALTLEEGEAENLAEGARGLQAKYGMPIDPAPYSRPFSSLPACRAVVAARLRAPGREQALLRRLRVRAMLGGLLDDPELLAAAAADVDLPVIKPDDEIEAALQADIAAARSPAPAARALDHKLGGPAGKRRYTAPSYELRRGDRLAVVPGFNPVEAYETTIANLAPELPRRAGPESVQELLAWAQEPLATAEIAAVMQRSMAPLRAELARVAEPIPAGADFFWRL